jgi:hypothetical protein
VWNGNSSTGRRNRRKKSLEMGTNVVFKEWGAMK